MAESLRFEGREYVPHPVSTLAAGVFVVAVGFALNFYVTGDATGYTGHGFALLLLGVVTLFAAAGSVDTATQWRFLLGLTGALLGSVAVGSQYPALLGTGPFTHVQEGLVVAAIFVGLLACSNSLSSRRSDSGSHEIRLSKKD